MSPEGDKNEVGLQKKAKSVPGDGQPSNGFLDHIGTGAINDADIDAWQEHAIRRYRGDAVGRGEESVMEDLSAFTVSSEADTSAQYGPTESQKLAAEQVKQDMAELCLTLS